MLIDLIAGARPNFMKIAPILREIQRRKSEGAAIDFRLIHTGQHYDRNMSDSFFEQLEIPDPHHNFGAGGGTQAEQTARIMTGYEALLETHGKPGLCLVVGDVTSTMACAIVAQKAHVKVAHVEAGIRSGDWTMPEEINRLVTDSISDYFYTTTEIANAQLRRSGVEEERIRFVGNTMIDTLLWSRDRFMAPPIWKEANLSEGAYAVMTLHRPANVDGERKLKDLLAEIARVSRGIPLVFPVHPRTAKNLKDLGEVPAHLHLVEPLSYLEFNFLVSKAKVVITDSGGITEETTVMGIPCMTLRDSTERPETVSIGTNELLGTDPKALEPAMDKLFSGNWKKGGIPELWDGRTAERIVAHLISLN